MSALGNARSAAANQVIQAAYNLNSVSDALTALENYRSSGTAIAQSHIYSGNQGTSDRDSEYNLNATVGGRGFQPQGGMGGEKKSRMAQRPTTAQQRKGTALAVHAFGQSDGTQSRGTRVESKMSNANLSSAFTHFNSTRGSRAGMNRSKASK